MDHDALIDAGSSAAVSAGDRSLRSQRAAGHRRARTRSERLEVEGVIHTTSPLLATQLACAGQGILRVNERLIQELMARGELVEILRDWSCYRLAAGGLPVYVVYAQSASAEPPLKSRVFVALLKGILAAEWARSTARSR